MTETATTPKVKRSRVTTGIFPGVWCWLLTPDTKFNAEGEYRVDLVMTADESRALLATVKDEVALQANEVRKQDGGKALEWKLAWPVKPYGGDDENLRGKMLVNFKQKIKSGFDFHVDVFDAHKNEIKPGTLRIGNGTRMRICFSVRVVADNMNKVVRVLFHPAAAQIIELVKWEADYGFEETDGFSAESSAGQPSTANNFDGDFDVDLDTGETSAEMPGSESPSNISHAAVQLAMREAWAKWKIVEPRDAAAGGSKWNTAISSYLPNKKKDAWTVADWRHFADDDFKTKASITFDDLPDAENPPLDDCPI